MVSKAKGKGKYIEKLIEADIRLEHLEAEVKSIKDKLEGRGET